MKSIQVVTPVKDSIDTALQTIDAVLASEVTVPMTLFVYNDNSTPENSELLKRMSIEKGFELINLSDLTSHPSPNYLTVLQTTQKKALADDAALIIVESDVVVARNTLQALFDGAAQRPDCGIAAAVTVDESGRINYPYKKFQGQENRVIDTRQHCSFCCSLLSPALLGAYSFDRLNPDKHWYDVTISHASLDCGLHNYLFTNIPVIHRPHSSRPWKQLKYTNPIKYYWRKFTKGFDKI